MGARERQKYKRQLENEFLKQKFHNTAASAGCHDFIIVLDNLKPNYNIGKIFRSAFAFGAQEIHVIGTKYFDPGPAKGALKYVPAKFYVDCQESLADLRGRGYNLFVLDSAGEKKLGAVELPRKSAFVLGNEGLGITFDYKNEDVKTLSITQFGKMESLNVSIAASIAMFEYVRQHDTLAKSK